MRIFGKNIPDNKKVPYALRYIVGIGKTTAEKICSDVGIDPTLKAGDLTDEQCKEIQDYAANNGILIGEEILEAKLKIMKAEITMGKIGTYRSSRWRNKLPCKGNSRNNGNTVRRGAGV